MRIVRFVDGDRVMRYGRLASDEAAYPLVGDLFGTHRFEADAVRVARLLAPVDPPNIFAIGLNYGLHADETGAKRPEEPVIFIKATTSLTATGEVIELPASAPDEVDYEAELAIVIGRRARRVPLERALEHVLGYTCANDVSARDCQKRRDKQWARGKSFDTFCPLGPWIVPASELDPDHCRIVSRLNGRTMQDSNTSDMIFSCGELVSYLSHQFTLLPGTVILTGTPGGVGFTREPAVFLRDGDRIEVEVEGVGVLQNTVVNGQARPHEATGST